VTPPTSTYRVQLGPGLTFTAAADLAAYLADLGVGALYTSPVLAATPGSTHGYDVADPREASPALGGPDGFAKLAARLREARLGLVVDIVPNHMGIAVPEANPFWWDVLRLGRESPHAAFFDIDWDRGPIMVPVLADDAAVADLTLEDGKLAYHDQRFPIAPGTDGGTPQQVHERQHYRLANWRRANQELNYRRFFDITTLAAVRVEDPEVFQATHRTVLGWVSDGQVTGLRVDHPDGLADPGAYLRQLREAAPGAWLVVEKILGPDETLPGRWPVDGTTGYDALRLVCGLFVDPGGEPALTELAEAECGPQDLREMEHSAKRWVAEHILRAEVRRITRAAARLVPGGETEPPTIEPAVIELLASFPVYRSYLADGEPEPLAAAATEAVRRQPHLADMTDELMRQMTGDPDGELAARVQQTAAMVMAKGVEDTVFYRYNRFVALNEVGGDPGRFGVEPREFHRRAARSAASGGHPASMTALSTHDTKRSEDVRARLAVLSEIPGEFAGAVGRWTARAGLPEPTLNLLAWQSLVGAWPISAERLRGYLEKASREAKLATSWTEPNATFDAAVAAWPGTVLGDAGLARDVERFVGLVRAAGWSNSLGQKLVQLAMPGVPDIYQGSELWDLSLVDPDNRRPVDFGLRCDLLARLDTGWQPEIDDSGAAKLMVVARTLRLRRERPELFTGYREMAGDGPAAGHVVAFERGGGNLVAVATRLPLTLQRNGGWRGTVLPLPASAGIWMDVFTRHSFSGTVPLAELLERYPVALLVREGR
jgi:(1->4)-alpha-D-glucan 1-alpha-D-glucosylmutase